MDDHRSAAQPSPAQPNSAPGLLGELPDHAARNRAGWNAESDAYEARNATQLELDGGMSWGVWHVPERELRALGDVAGRDVLELGCGAARWSIGLARLGARVTGLDLSDRQLEHARRNQAAAGITFPLVHASGEAVPLPDLSFDLVFCDHGAMTFADPYRTVPEAARLLRPGGLLVFNHTSTLLQLAWPMDSEHPGDRLVRDYFDLHRIDDPDGDVEFALTYGEWIRLFRANGFEVLDLIELRPSAGASSTYRDATDLAWARRWPMESLWRVRKGAQAPG
jgi:SAM-dependent methyltransferase